MNYVCTANVRMSHPHSFPLRFLAEWGFPAMLALMMVFLAPGVRILRQLRGQSPEQAGDRFLSGCLMASVVCAALYACLSGVLIMPASQVAGVMIFGGLLGMSGLAGRREGYRGARKICTSGALMSMLLLVLGWFELSTMDSRSEKLRPGDDLLPRDFVTS
jgi:hypothetical protein